MSQECLYTLADLCRELDSYGSQLRVFMEDAGIEPRATIAGRKVYDRSALERLRPLVEAWKNRPRLCRRVATAS